VELPLVLVVAIVALTVAFAATSSKLICILNMNADNYIYMLVNRLKTNIFFVNVHLKLLSPEAFFSPKCTKYRLAAGLRPDPLGELTALPQTP